MELHELTALQLGEKIRAGEVSPVEAAQAALDRVRQEQGRNNAFITVLGDAALSEALETGETTARRSAAEPAGRSADGAQRQHLHQRHQDLLRL